MAIKKIVLSSKNDVFLRKVSELSGQVITLCDQCGVCSASCPMVSEMDITPSQIMRKVQLNQKEVIESKAIWSCASCFSCTARCPRGLDLSRVTEALRQIDLRNSIDHINLKKIPKEEINKLPQIALISAFRKFIG